MKKYKYKLTDLKKLGEFPMPERSANNAKAEWPVEPLQDKNFIRQNLNDGSVSMQQRSQELADEAKAYRDLSLLNFDLLLEDK